MTRTNRILALVPLALAVTLGGCVSQTPIVDRHFGEAALAARAQQTFNPDAPKASAVAPGLDGRAAKHALDRYHESFKETQPTGNFFNVGVGQED